MNRTINRVLWLALLMSATAQAQQAAPSRAIAWGTPASQAPLAAPRPFAPAQAQPPIAEGIKRAAPPATFTQRALPAPLAASTPATGATVRLADILDAPDAQAVNGGATTAGEVKRRYAQWLQTELTKRPRTTMQRVVRPVAAMGKRPGAGLKVMDPQLVGELRGLDNAALVRSGETGTAAQAPIPVSGRKVVGAQLTTAPLPCTEAQAAFANGSSAFLSTVNRHPKDFWVNLDADERLLTLSGCFGKAPGEVRLQGSFPKGYVTANIVLWEERVIVAQVPMMSGLPDQDVSVRVLLANRQSTNERSGHLWARREERTLDTLAMYASSGDCPARGQAGEHGPAFMAVAPPKYPLGTSIPFLDNMNRASKSSTCELPQGATTPNGVTRFKGRLSPGWEIVDLSLQPFLGSARLDWVGETDFDIHWQAASFQADHRFLGIPTGSEVFHALGFTVDQLRVRGPAGTAPTNAASPN